MAIFKKAFEVTMVHEGIYSNLPTDRGGETFCGISRVHHPNWVGWDVIDTCKELREDIRDLVNHPTMQHQLEIFYKGKYWDSWKGDLFSSQEVANELFDTAVNMGVGVAKIFLQRSVNLLNRQGKITPDLVVDGAIGPKTLRGLSAIIQRRDPITFQKVLNGLQFSRYVDIVERDRTQEENFYGWIRARI